MRVCVLLERWVPRPGQLETWGHREAVLAGWDFAALRAALHNPGTPADDKDDLLAALVRTAGTDPDAVTALVACLLPGVKTLVRRLAAGADVEEVRAEVLAQLVAHVNRYDLTRRPRRIAANLLLDSFAHTLNVLGRERRWQQARILLDDVDLPPASLENGHPGPVDEAVRLGSLTRADGVLIVSTRLAGLSLGEAASLLGLSYDTAKKRRQRAELRLVRWLGGDALGAAVGGRAGPLDGEQSRLDRRGRKIGSQRARCHPRHVGDGRIRTRAEGHRGCAMAQEQPITQPVPVIADRLTRGEGAPWREGASRLRAGADG